MSQLVTDSPLDWTIARFTRPTDGPRTSNVRAGYLGRDRIRASITRADIANFLLAQTNDTPHHRTAPAITNERHVAPTQTRRRRSNAQEPLPLECCSTRLATAQFDGAVFVQRVRDGVRGPPRPAPGVRG
jgi:hypothetical protein